MSKLHYGFLDESGVIEEQAHKGNYFVITVVIVGNPQEIKHVIKQARHQANGRFRFHRVFKASKEERGLASLVLKELAKRNVGIVVSLLDKSQQDMKMQDANTTYARLVGQTIALVLDRYPHLALTAHKRYTLPRIRHEMDRIVNQCVHEGTFLSIDHRTEIECRELELADAVAFAVFQKYNHRDSVLYDIIKGKIQTENRMADTYPKVFAFLDGHIANFHEDVADAEKEMNAPTATNAERAEKERLIAKWKEMCDEYSEALNEFRKGKLGPVTKIIGKRIGQDLDSDDQEKNAIARSREGA